MKVPSTRFVHYLQSVAVSPIRNSISLWPCTYYTYHIAAFKPGDYGGTLCLDEGSSHDGKLCLYIVVVATCPLTLNSQKAEEAFGASEVPVGCVFVQDNKIIARARNRTNELRNATRHAELEAIDEIIRKRQAEEEEVEKVQPQEQYLLKDVTLYVTVEPCMMCSSALRQMGIKAVYFGCENERFGGCGSVLGVNERYGRLRNRSTGVG